MSKILLLMMCSFISLSSASFSMDVEEEQGPPRKRVFSSDPNSEKQEHREFSDCSIIVYNMDVPLEMNGSATEATIGFTPEKYSNDWDKYNRSWTISLPPQGQSCDAKLKPGPYKVRLTASFMPVNSSEGFYWQECIENCIASTNSTLVLIASRAMDLGLDESPQEEKRELVLSIQ